MRHSRLPNLLQALAVLCLVGTLSHPASAAQPIARPVSATVPDSASPAASSSLDPVPSDVDPVASDIASGSPSGAPSDLDLPDAPGPQAATSVGASAAAIPDHTHPPQTKRILGILPNFRSVTADTRLPPQSVREKFSDALADSFDYSSVIFAGVQAGAAMASDSTPEFHQGAAGFARYYWHTFADQADENIWVEGILPSLLHHDTRYYTLGHGNPAHRAEYAITRVLITRTDDGGKTFNTSEILGAGTAASISALYYPHADVTWTKVSQRWLTNVILDGSLFTVKEFWPDLNSAVFHTKD